jgi:hypothetical protein
MNIDEGKEKILLKYSSKISALFIIIAIFGFAILMLPFAFEGSNTPNYGIVGDTVGGLLNPLIAIPATILTFLAFWVQYKANDEVRKQFKIQQFESQFYEMIHLHKENVNELSIDDFLNDSSTSDVKREIKGRHVFFKLTEIFETLLKYSKNVVTYDMNKKEFNDAYLIFFWGFSYSTRVDAEFKKKLEGSGIYSDIGLGKFAEYEGVSFLLGHYYRHLFMTVKFVVDSTVITDYEEKMKYLKILRSQLSNHEQIILFYNWLSGFGGEWEDEKNHFFTKYKMIHNLWDEQLYKEPYIIKAVNDLIEAYNSNFINKEGFKPMFEFQGDDFDIKI